MKILVCIKQVPASNKVEVDPVTGVLKRDGAASKMNPYDLYALEAAFRIRSQLGGTVSVLTMGPGQAAAVVREAFAMGADEGYVLSDRKFAGADVLATSYTLSLGIRTLGSFDLILCGKQTTDGDTAQVGPSISERLGVPAIANVFEIREVTGESITGKMDLGEQFQVARIPYPCLISVDKDIYTPRLPSYLRAKATAEREVKLLTFNELAGAEEDRVGLAGSPTQVRRIFPPEGRGQTQVFTGTPDELADAMFRKLSDAKFI